MTHLLLGSIGVLAETSDLQRQAFNTAFKEAGLDWHWHADHYAEMLVSSGGKDRIAAYADDRGEEVDAEALHARKSKLFQESLARGVPLRPGIAETMETIRAQGGKIAFVTSTSPANVTSILDATGLSMTDFDLVLSNAEVPETKPAPAPYHAALKQLDIAVEDCIAVEDNPDGVASAKAAGLTVIALPGAMHENSNFDHADIVQTELDLPANQNAA